MTELHGTSPGGPPVVYPDELPDHGWPARLGRAVESLRQAQHDDRRALLDAIAALSRDVRARERWSAFGSAAGSAIVLTLWHLLSYLLSRGQP